ncbi:MAG: hypothetical protein Dasosvirus1_1, partial [Dasosvirus sp.]
MDTKIKEIYIKHSKQHRKQHIFDVRQIVVERLSSVGNSVDDTLINIIELELNLHRIGSHI